LKSFFSGHECMTVPKKGWTGKSNGELVQRAEAEFEVFVTTDRNLAFQQT
jgi:hypothetical protein